VALHPGQVVSQAIDFSTGTYSLTVQAAQRAVDGDETFNVLVDGQVVGSFHPGGTSYSTFTTNNFALSAGSRTIEFLGVGGAGSKQTALIDDLRLNTIQAADHLLFTQQPSDTVAGQSISPAVTVAIVLAVKTDWLPEPGQRRALQAASITPARSSSLRTATRSLPRAGR
jgi:hypothetical protein